MYTQIFGVCSTDKYCGCANSPFLGWRRRMAEREMLKQRHGALGWCECYVVRWWSVAVWSGSRMMYDPTFRWASSGKWESAISRVNDSDDDFERSPPIFKSPSSASFPICWRFNANTIYYGNRNGGHHKNAGQKHNESDGEMGKVKEATLEVVSDLTMRWWKRCGWVVEWNCLGGSRSSK